MTLEESKKYLAQNKIYISVAKFNGFFFAYKRSTIAGYDLILCNKYCFNQSGILKYYPNNTLFGTEEEVVRAALKYLDIVNMKKACL